MESNKKQLKSFLMITKKYLQHILFLSLLCFVLSCSSKNQFYEANGSGLKEMNTYYGPAVVNATYGAPDYTISGTDTELRRKFSSEKNYVDALQEKIRQGKDCEENEKKLKVMSDRLIASCKERVLNRINFLRAFYTDLPKLNEEEFMKKYRKHCSRGILKELKKSSEANHLNHEYNLTLFYNNQNYNPAELKYNYTYKDPFKPGKPEEKYELFPFFNKENKWIQISMADESILVKVEGEDKHIAIVGLYNESKNIKIDTQYDR